MGRSVNKVTLIGTLGRDPEVRYMPNGNAVANLSLATDESYNDRQTGQKVEQTEWHRITVYGKLAEIVQQYLKKGARAYFEGKLRTREWEKDGVKRYTTEIIANDMLMLDGRNSDMGASSGMGGGMNSGYQQPQNASGMMNAGAPAGNYGQAPQQPAPQQNPAQGGYSQPSQQPAPQQNPAQGGYSAPQQPAQPAPQQAPAQGGYSQPPQQPAQPAQQPSPSQAPAQGGYQQPPQQPRQPAPQQTTHTPPPANNFDDFDDDIPF